MRRKRRPVEPRDREVPASRLNRFAEVGEGSRLMRPLTVYGSDRIHVGRDVTILPGAFLSVVERYHEVSYDARLIIGDGCELGRDLVVACYGSVEIGPEVLAADRVFIGDSYRDYRNPVGPIRHQPLIEPRPVKIGAGAFLGINACVMPGVEVGERAYIGAGAIVTADIPPLAVAVGNPARVVRRWDERTGEWIVPDSAPLG